jgi:hypothetical protein
MYPDYKGPSVVTGQSRKKGNFFIMQCLIKGFTYAK